MEELRKALEPELLYDLRRIWFSHLPDESHIIVPGKEDAQVWFLQNDTLDNTCRAKFGDSLETIESLKPSADEILAAAEPESGLDWMSLILLLDQIPRNCYRGMEAAKVYNVFDPLALAIALKAAEARITDKIEIRFHIAYAIWFYIPMEHAEDLAMQQLAADEHKRIFEDAERLMQGSLCADGDIMATYRKCLLQRQEELFACKKIFHRAVDKHLEAIKQFGRFPARNDCLGRVTTTEEQALLESGWSVTNVEQ